MVSFITHIMLPGAIHLYYTSRLTWPWSHSSHTSCYLGQYISIIHPGSPGHGLIHHTHHVTWGNTSLLYIQAHLAMVSFITHIMLPGAIHLYYTSRLTWPWSHSSHPSCYLGQYISIIHPGS